MGKEGEGIVIELKGEYAVVMPTTHSGCDAAHCCQGEGVTKVNVEMINDIKSQPGDKIVYIAKESGMLKAAFIVYALPMIMIFLGAFAGYNGAPNFNIDPTLLASISGVLAFILSIIIIKKYDNFASNNRNLKPHIIRIIQKKTL